LNVANLTIIFLLANNRRQFRKLPAQSSFVGIGMGFSAQCPKFVLAMSKFSAKTRDGLWALGMILAALLLSVGLFIGAVYGIKSPMLMDPYLYEGEMTDPSIGRFVYMIAAFILGIALTAFADKGRSIKRSFFLGTLAGFFLWQSLGECAWQFRIPCGDFYLNLPSLEGANSVFYVILSLIALAYIIRNQSFSFGIVTALLSFCSNWLGHFIMMGTYPPAASSMGMEEWFHDFGIFSGSAITILGLVVLYGLARTVKARYSAAFLIYMGLGCILVGISGI